MTKVQVNLRFFYVARWLSHFLKTKCKTFTIPQFEEEFVAFAYNKTNNPTHVYLYSMGEEKIMGSIVNINRLPAGGLDETFCLAVRER